MAISKTILICDDDQGMRDTIGAILKRDYRVLTVSSGEAALTLMKQEDVDLIRMVFEIAIAEDEIVARFLPPFPLVRLTVSL